MAVFVKQPGKKRFKGTAGETVATGDAVCIKQADGKIYLADADDTDLRPCRGVIGKGGAAAAEVEVLQEAVLGGFSGLTPGANQYLSNTAGDFTETAATDYQQCGFALTATEMQVATLHLSDN
jgi:hypothetical protein